MSHSQFTKRDLAAEAWRELEMRRKNYPRWVAAGKMQQKTADRQIALQEAIYRTLVKMPDEGVKGP